MLDIYCSIYNNIIYTTYLFHAAHPFVSRGERELRLSRPVSRHCVHICVADAAGFQLHQDLVSLGLGDLRLRVGWMGVLCGLDGCVVWIGWV
jgi:hypothetical protein